MSDAHIPASADNENLNVNYGAIKRSNEVTNYILETIQTSDVPYITQAQINDLGRQYLGDQSGYVQAIDLLNTIEPLDPETGVRMYIGPISTAFFDLYGEEVDRVCNNPQAMVYGIFLNILHEYGYELTEQERRRREGEAINNHNKQESIWFNNPHLKTKLEELCADSKFRTWQQIADELGHGLTDEAVKLFAKYSSIEKVEKVPTELRRKNSKNIYKDITADWEANNGFLSKRLKELIDTNKEPTWKWLVAELQKDDPRVNLNNVQVHAAEMGYIKPTDRSNLASRLNFERSIRSENDGSPSLLANELRDLYIEHIHIPRSQGKNINGKLREILTTLQTNHPDLDITYSQVSSYTSRNIKPGLEEA